jgi:hypothetical protein
MKMETTHVSETSTLYNNTPGSYPKEDNIRFSQHGESLKTRKSNTLATPSAESWMKVRRPFLAPMLKTTQGTYWIENMKNP